MAAPLREAVVMQEQLTLARTRARRHGEAERTLRP
jgi:hypothetical protein